MANVPLHKSPLYFGGGFCVSQWSQGPCWPLVGSPKANDEERFSWPLLIKDYRCPALWSQAWGGNWRESVWWLDHGLPSCRPSTHIGGAVGIKWSVCRWQRPEVRSLDTETGYQEEERQPSHREGAWASVWGWEISAQLRQPQCMAWALESNL